MNSYKNEEVMMDVSIEHVHRYSQQLQCIIPLLLYVHVIELFQEDHIYSEVKPTPQLPPPRYVDQEFLGSNNHNDHIYNILENPNERVTDL